MSSNTVGVISLGCAKNLVDTEIALGFLQKSGFELVSDPAQAQVIIINTCGFIESAKQESIDTILEMAEYKTHGSCEVLIVSGCLSARYKDELWREMPEIDGIVGTGEMHLIGEIVTKALGGERISKFSSQLFDYDDPNVERIVSTGAHSAYLKIAEGCDHSCAFCAIPLIRGPYRSRQVAAIVAEAKRLVAEGVQEVNIIAQDTTKYGRDLSDGTNLVILLNELIKLDIPWIRILYTYPAFFSDELIELMAKNDRIINYVDLPLQHASSSVLKRMRRPGNYTSQLELIKKLRDRIKNVTIRSSFIVGFPGETESEFEELVNFITEAQLNHCGVFQFSPEEDTIAYDLPDQISDQVKLERYQKLMEIQQSISLAKQQALVGQELDVLVEGLSQESDLVIVGRHQGQAPEVDGVVYLGDQADIGEIVKVRITQAHPYDLVGEIVRGGNNNDLS